MSRTRTISDQQVLDATIELVGRQGVSRLTFASLSVATGLSAATLVQRFGTKKQLLTAVTKHCLQSMVPIITKAQNEHDSPLQAIYVAFESLAGAITSVEEFANGQVFFYLALTDPETNALLRQSMIESRNKIEQLLDEAVRIKELKACDTTALAMTLQTVYEGAITTWLVYQQNDIKSWVTGLLSEAVKPYKATL